MKISPLIVSSSSSSLKDAPDLKSSICNAIYALKELDEAMDYINCLESLQEVYGLQSLADQMKTTGSIAQSLIQEFRKAARSAPSKKNVARDPISSKRQKLQKPKDSKPSQNSSPQPSSNTTVDSTSTPSSPNQQMSPSAQEESSASMDPPEPEKPDMPTKFMVRQASPLPYSMRPLSTYGNALQTNLLARLTRTMNVVDLTGEDTPPEDC